MVVHFQTIGETDADLSRFDGALLVQICIGEFQVQFHFQQVASNLHQGASISVEGKWEIRNSAGLLVDGMEMREQSISQREGFYAHCLLGGTIIGYRVDPPESLTLQFSSGHALTVFDESRQYESFSIQPGDIFI